MKNIICKISNSIILHFSFTSIIIFNWLKTKGRGHVLLQTSKFSACKKSNRRLNSVCVYIFSFLLLSIVMKMQRWPWMACLTRDDAYIDARIEFGNTIKGNNCIMDWYSSYVLVEVYHSDIWKWLFCIFLTCVVCELAKRGRWTKMK